MTSLLEGLFMQKRSNQAHIAQDNIKGGHSSWPRLVRTEDHIVTVRQCFDQSPRKSTESLS